LRTEEDEVILNLPYTQRFRPFIELAPSAISTVAPSI